VQRGDTLWSIAETHLGNPERWREIARLNYDHPQPDGRTLTNSHWIYPGWHLRLPPDPATAHAAHRHTDAAATSPSPIRQAQPAPHEPTPATAPSAKPSVIDGRTPASPPAERLTSAPSITLASGSEISAAFAVGVLAAMSTARLRRRRAYRPAPPMPATTPTGAPPAAALRALMIATRPRDEDGDSELSSDEARPPTTTDGTGVDVAPGTLEIGTRDSRRITLGLTEWACLAITGEARDSVVRFWLASLIVDSGPYGADIIGAAATLDRLIPGLSERLHALRPVADADAVLASLEAEQLRRTRLLADADVESVADLRGLHAEDPLPITIAVLDSIDPRRAARWELLTTAASRLGMRILTLDADGHGRGRAHLVTDVDGAILSAEPAEFRHALGGVRLFTMTVDEALVFLGPVAAASRESDEQTASDSIAGQTETQAGSCSLTPEVPQALSFPPPPATVAMARWPIQRPTDAEPPVALRLFGPIALRAWGRPIDVGLRDSARELLAWYVVHPDGVPAGTAIEGIWPDVPADRGSQRFWNALGNLRSRLRGPGGERLDVLTKIGDSYRPDVNALDVDIWRFQDALDHAVRDESRARDVLMVAANLYRGEFAGTSDYVWVAPVREEFHRRALDAYVRLAELHDEAGEADAAVEILERAITLDPVAEEIYRRLIRLLGRAGRADAVSRLWAQLQGRLADIDLDPEPATITLVRRIQNAGADPQIVNASRH
jgi:DNA-binding SARP family transcriptional activator